ncbi:hypothetical protein L1281_002566 [Neisseria sp. HSC-16F19]|nr:hypothetical protein [Neisseria sp. HSC-16F19]MCP2041948.1 hypothetical protein [Neisseria sp. HSC-16F19]
MPLYVQLFVFGSGIKAFAQGTAVLRCLCGADVGTDGGQGGCSTLAGLPVLRFGIVDADSGGVDAAGGVAAAAVADAPVAAVVALALVAGDVAQPGVAVFAALAETVAAEGEAAPCAYALAVMTAVVGKGAAAEGAGLEAVETGGFGAAGGGDEGTVQLAVPFCADAVALISGINAALPTDALV